MKWVICCLSGDSFMCTWFLRCTFSYLSTACNSPCTLAFIVQKLILTALTEQSPRWLPSARSPSGVGATH